MKMKILTMIALILLAASIATPKPAKADNTTDDTLYLRRPGAPQGNLTTATPPNQPPYTITMNAGSSYTYVWINQTTNAQDWSIAGGNYTFYVWLERVEQGAVVNVSVTFGYIKNGVKSSIATFTRSNIQVGSSSVPIEYQVSGNGGAATIYAGSNLFLQVTFTVSGAGVYFHYDGLGGQGNKINTYTHIVTPVISAQVPEFPLGVAFLLPMMVSAYLALRRLRKI